MNSSKQERRLFMSAAFFAFGGLCGVLTACSGSAALSAAAVEKSIQLLRASTLGTCVLSALAAPILLLILGTTLFGAFLILPCVLLSGGFTGWLLCCFLRPGVETVGGWLLPVCVLIPQIPCMLRVASGSMSLSASLRTMAAGNGSRRPDLSVELRTMALCFFILLLSAVLISMCLRRWFLS